jgi:osmotically-inducible protein OsmY
MTSVMVAVCAGAIGAVISHLWDPDRGRARRRRLRDQCASAVRRSERRMRRAGARRLHYAEGRMHGAVHRALPDRHREAPDDTTLAQKVRSEVLGAPEFRALAISVDVSDGVVHLRGEVRDPTLIDELVAAVSRMRGVHRVDSYLHTPGTVSPNKEDALRTTRV